MTARFRRLARWLFVEPRLCWYWLLGGLAVWGTAFWISPTIVEQLQYTGITLEVFGVVLVGAGYLRLRSEFGRRPVRAEVWDWIRWPLGRTKTIRIEAIESRVVVGGSARIETWHNRPRWASLQERIATLEKNQRILRGSLKKARASLEESIREHRRETRDEIGALKERDEETDSRLEDVSIGGLGIEVVGLAWVAAGLACSFLSTFVAASYGYSP